MMSPSISDYYRQRIIPDVKGEILRETDEQILGTDVDELKKYYYEKYAWSPIEEDPDNEASYDVQEYLKTIPAHERGRGYSGMGDLRDFQCQRVVIEIPILSNKDIREISGLIGNTYSISYSDSDFRWDDTRISCIIETKGYGFTYDESKIAGEVERALGRMRETIRYKNESISAENAGLLKIISQMISERKQKIGEKESKLSELTKKISIPLKRKSVIGAKPVRLVQKPLVQRIKPKPTLPEEYVLDEDGVGDIIQFLDGQAKNFENTPKAIKGLGEEDLRDLLLANLNSIFQGDATGETFSKNGKTDIYLKIKKGNILICECKIWSGKELYGKTIDQLRGYLTWRHNYGIIITFVRLKGFTKVLDESETAIKKHVSFIGSFKRLESSHFVSNHTVDDNEKEVCIHHLFYHLV